MGAHPRITNVKSIGNAPTPLHGAIRKAFAKKSGVKNQGIVPAAGATARNIAENVCCIPTVPTGGATRMAFARRRNAKAKKIAAKANAANRGGATITNPRKGARNGNVKATGSAATKFPGATHRRKFVSKNNARAARIAPAADAKTQAFVASVCYILIVLMVGATRMVFAKRPSAKARKIAVKANAANRVGVTITNPRRAARNGNVKATGNAATKFPGATHRRKSVSKNNAKAARIAPAADAKTQAL